MLTAETNLDTARRPALPVSDGWYDPDGIGFQADDDERDARMLKDPAGELVPVDVRVPVGSATG